MLRLLASAALFVIVIIPMGMIVRNASFLESLQVGLAIGFLVLISPFVGGRR